jgi:dTDP-4-dehydrorhamnose 3,5-epimerase
MSQFKVEKTALKGVLAILPPTNFEDFRGSYVETYNRELFHAAGITQDFIQDDISTSTRGVLRGIHGDGKTWKLITCLYGSFYFVVVNNDPNSDEYKKSISFTLSDRNRVQILVPPNFGNGHLVTSDEAIFHYKQTTTYDRSSQFTIKWNNPEYSIWWPTQSPILSERDSA